MGAVAVVGRLNRRKDGSVEFSTSHLYFGEAECRGFVLVSDSARLRDLLEMHMMNQPPPTIPTEPTRIVR